MAGPEGTAQALAEAGHRNGRGKAFGINLRRIRHIKHMRTQRSELCSIFIFGARIGCEVGGTVELVWMPAVLQGRFEPLNA